MINSLLKLLRIFLHLCDQILTIWDICTKFLRFQKVNTLDGYLFTDSKKVFELFLIFLAMATLPLNLGKIAFALFSSLFHSHHFSFKRVNFLLFFRVYFLDWVFWFLARSIRILLCKTDLFLDRFLTNSRRGEDNIFDVVQVSVYLQESVGFLVIFHWNRLVVSYLRPLLNQV